MESCLLLREIHTASGHAFGHATLNAPASLNALSLAMIERLAPAVERWREDPRIAGIVIDGAGDKAFCAGGDVAALYRAIVDTRARVPGQVPPVAAEFFEREYRLDHRLHTCPKPVLVWGGGIVMGGGIGLLAGGSHRVVTPRSRLAMPEVAIGLYPDVGGSWFLRRMPGCTGLFLALTGIPLNAGDARHAGLADFVLPQDAHEAVILDIAATRWTGERSHDATSLAGVLRSRSVEAPQSPLAANAGRIDEAVGRDTLAGIADALRTLASDQDPWLAAAGIAFAAGSPTSSALAYSLWKRAERLPLADVFRLEYQVSLGCCMHHDFAEGVRALLIDKDRRPRWQPATLAEVNEAHLAAHFLPRHTGRHPLADLA